MLCESRGTSTHTHSHAHAHVGTHSPRMSWKGDAHYGGLYALSVQSTLAAAAAAGRRHRQLLFLFVSVLVAVAAVWILVPVFAFYRSVNDHIVYTGVCASLSVCTCVFVCMSCRKLTPPPGHSRRFCQARCDGFSRCRSLSLSLFRSSCCFSLSGLTFRLSYFWKKQVLYRAVLRAGSGSPKVHFSSFLCRSAACTCQFPLSSLSILSPLVPCAHSLSRHALILPFSCLSLSRCACFSCLYHPCHIPFL